MAQLLLELFSEEIPSRMQARAGADLARLVGDKLKAAGLEAGEISYHHTPRRITLVVESLPEAQPDVREERRGPRVGAPEKAVEGFLKGSGLTLNDVEERDTGKGVFYFAVIERKGRPTAEVLAEILPEALGELPWAKSMKWGERSLRWVRPLHSILCLFAGSVVPFAFGHIESGDTTFGHRFMAPDAITVKDFADYKARLRGAYVMLDAEERRHSIFNDATRLAEGEGLELVTDPSLLDEVAGLVEWPVVLIGRIDDAFMEVPAEVLTSAMRGHQKYFSLNHRGGGLAPRFILVSNLMAEDGGHRIVDGNERVLRARLSDAKFFWDQDRKQTLESRVPALAEVVFHARLGTVLDRVERMVGLAEFLCSYIPGADAAEAARAARLAKADLTSGMVGEFPELQGLMGSYYAAHDGESEAVAAAIAAHYAPQGPSDSCPKAPVSVAVALAEKIDTLAGFFAIDEKPTGSKDPYALRRAALGVIRLVLENDLRMPLLEVFETADQYRRNDALEKTIIRAEGSYDSGARLDGEELLAFFADRLKVHLREQGVRHDLVSAVFALGGEDDLVRLLARVTALKDFLETDDGANMLTAYRRAANILRIEEKKDGRSYEGLPHPELLGEEAEHALNGRLEEVSSLAAAALERDEFAVAGQALATLRRPVDKFFDDVTVNAEDAALRENRLKLLSRIRAELDQLGDFSKIEG